MEVTTKEMSIIETAVKQGQDADVRELSDLQLALIGGGVGEVIVG